MNYALLAVASVAVFLAERSESSERSKAKQKSSLLYPTFLFLGWRKGFLLTKRRPFRPQTPTYPTAREMLLHFVQVYLALSRLTFLNLHFQDTGLGASNLQI